MLFHCLKVYLLIYVYIFPCFIYLTLSYTAFCATSSQPVSMHIVRVFFFSFFFLNSWD